MVEVLIGLTVAFAPPVFGYLWHRRAERLRWEAFTRQANVAWAQSKMQEFSDAWGPFNEAMREAAQSFKAFGQALSGFRLKMPRWQAQKYVDAGLITWDDVDVFEDGF